MQCKMCSEHNKLTILHPIRMWRVFRLTWQPLLGNEVSRGSLSSHMSHGVDTFPCLKNSQY